KERGLDVGAAFQNRTRRIPVLLWRSNRGSSTFHESPTRRRRRSQHGVACYFLPDRSSLTRCSARPNRLDEEHVDIIGLCFGLDVGAAGFLGSRPRQPEGFIAVFGEQAENRRYRRSI